MVAKFDWYRSASYDAQQKQLFHRHARARLKALAVELRFPPGSYDLRSNAGGIAVSGEITLHHDAIYIQVCQPATGWDSGIMIRSCKGRRDYTGGANNFVRLRMLDDLPALADRVRSIMHRNLSSAA